MARLSDEFISQLKSANDIVDLFRTYADVKKHGRIYTCCCPFHSEKTPSCTIYPESASFYCFGCHVGGDVVKFVMLMDNVNYMEAVHILAQRSGLTIPSQTFEDAQSSQLRDRCYEINRETANFYYQNLFQSPDKKGLQFLKFHHIQPATVKKYALGYASDDWQSLHHHLRQKGYSDKELFASELFRKNQNNKLYDYFRNRIIFPIVDFRGNVVAFGGMALDTKQSAFLYTESSPVSDRKKVIFSLNFAKKETSVNFIILAEDYFNAVSVYQAGFPNVIALPDSLNQFQVKALSQYTSEIVLIQSQAAHAGDLQTIQNLLSESEMHVKILTLSETPCSAEWIHNFGTKAFQERLLHTEDAVQTALQKSWNGFDMEQDKTAVIHETAKILSGIKDKLEREIYLSEMAQKLNLTPEQMQAQIDQISNMPVKRQSASSISISTEALIASIESRNPHEPTTR
ncbi:MAG: DNA primase [Oscillospiraceae bacterium]|nr:DNA primase [Oscillospiraceae bacterium]